MPGEPGGGGPEAGEDDGDRVGGAEVAGIGGCWGVVALHPPAVAVPAHRALDGQLARALHPADEHDRSGTGPGPRAHEHHVTIGQRW